MAALILPSRRVVQPQGPVEVDWGNPLTRGLVLAISPAAGIKNLVGKGYLVSSRANAVSATGSGFSSSAGEAEYAATANIANGITLFTIMRARSGGYLFADEERHILSSRNAGNQGWSWYRVAAASGGSFGNVTKQGFTIQGVAGYSEANQTIPSDLDTPVAVRYNKATGAISWFANGVKSSADTSASTAALTGGALNYRQQGPFSNNFGRYLDLLNNTLAFERMLSDAEIAELCANSWQVYRPIQRRIWVSVAGGGGISQTVAFTLEDVSAAVSQTLSHAQSLTGTLEDVTVSISQTAQHSQALDAALDGVTVAASQTLSHSQALAATLDGITVEISQSAAPSSKDQSLAVTLDSIAVSIAQEGPASLIDTHDGFWAKEWARIRAREKRKYQEEIQERVEEIQDEIAEVEQQIVEVKQAPKPKKATPARDFYAEQARIVEHLIARRNQLIDEEDEELLLLL